MSNALQLSWVAFAIAMAAGSSVSWAAPASRITIQSMDGKMAFHNKATGADFIPKGYNYTVIESRGADPSCQNRHVTFDTNKYDPWLAESFWSQMEYDGFNTVQVMLDWGDVCRQAVGQYSVTPPSPFGSEIYSTYLANVVDFLTRAKAHNTRVILTMNYAPPSPYYLDLVVGGTPLSPEITVNIAGS